MEFLLPQSFVQFFLGISPKEVFFARRGFRAENNSAVIHLETVGKTFLDGYHLTLLCKDTLNLEEKLAEIENSLRGFAFEGAAMGLALLDCLTPRKTKYIKNFLEGEAGRRHIYMTHVGIGWALARLPWTRYRILPNINKFDSLLKWLIVDGFGFHEGYFKPRRYFQPKNLPTWIPGYARHAFSQGLGRSLWFVEGANVEAVARKIFVMPEAMRADLWSGVGLACAYAGRIETIELTKLRNLAEGFQDHLAQGVTFAVKTRQRAENMTAYTELACRILCRCAADEAAFVSDDALENLPQTENPEVPNYEIWRRRIRKKISSEAEKV